MLEQATNWHVKNGLLYGADNYVAAWVNEQIDGSQSMPTGGFYAVGYLRENELAGGVIYHSKQPRDILMVVAINKLMVTSRLLTRCLRYPFKVCDLPRVTMEISDSNRRSKRLAEVCGAVQEGRKRGGASDGSDMLIYGILRDEYRFKGQL